MGRKPGPLCGHDLGRDWIDSGTLARTRHHPPGPLGTKVESSSQEHTLTDEVDIPLQINTGLHAPSEEFMHSLLGRPRDNFNDKCQKVTNMALIGIIENADFKVFKATGLRAALTSLHTILESIKKEHPLVYRNLGTAGMLCCRYQRNSSRISNHSWGTAIDLTICGKLDRYGNRKVQYGLLLIAPIFNRNGWVWGAAYRKEDGMHFEVSMETLLKWKSDGQLAPVVPALPKTEKVPIEQEILHI